MLNLNYICSAGLGLFVFLSIDAFAENSLSSDYGAIEFEKSCSSCHGFDGKGKGYMAESLKVPPADLTGLTKNNSGHFPFIEIYQAIEGSSRVGVHREREMPAWGKEFRKEANTYGVNEYLYTRGVIMELITYIYSIQVQ